MSARYEGKVVSVWLPDGRNMELREAFAYIDAADLRWDVPQGARVDGASIPRLLWTLIGGPFEGKYRDASVVHDWFCDVRTRPSKTVHRMFYEAMLTSGVSAAQARMLYAGVQFGGPKWGENTVSNAQLASIYGSVAKTRKGEKNLHIGFVTDLQAGAAPRSEHDRSKAHALTIVRELAAEMDVSPFQIGRTLNKPGAKLKRGVTGKPGVRRVVPAEKMKRVINAAVTLSLDEIDALIEKESRGLKIEPIPTKQRRKRKR